MSDVISHYVRSAHTTRDFALYDKNLEPHDFVRIHKSDLIALRRAIVGAHASLTKSSLIPEERVQDATLALSRVLHLLRVPR
jgi:hypothetical protein